MEYVVDAQGFRGASGEFVIKELAVSRLNSDERPLTFLFKPSIAWYDLPARYKSINLWLERNYHHLCWDSGDLGYDEVEGVLRSVLHNAGIISVKGREKQQWLQQFGFDARDIIACPSLKTSKKVMTCCFYHDSLHCALRNVLTLGKFICANRPSVGRSLKLFYHCGLLSSMEPEDISQSPKEFIITFAAYSVDLAWNKLPEFLKTDPDVVLCLRCRGHTTQSSPAPLQRECKQCILNAE